MNPPLKPVEWIASSLDDLKDFPEEVQQVIGYALYQAQCGEKHPDAKPLKGFKGSGVLESKLLRTLTGTLTDRFTQSDLRGLCMSCTSFRRNLSRELPLPNKTLN
jgi:hypothetical protein